MNPRKLFVAGATGATGKVLVPMGRARSLDVVAHVRPKSAHGSPSIPGAAIVDLANTPALVKAMEGCTTVIQLIGTMRKRFSSGDTYETSDIGTTAQLIAAAKLAQVDHLILLSSVGAGSPRGAYLQAKAQAEKLVVESGLDFTIFRPSMLEGGERRPIPGARAIIRLLGLKRYEPISLDELSAAMLRTAERRTPLGVSLEGESLWAEVSGAEGARVAAS